MDVPRIVSATGFELELPDEIGENHPPTPEELRLLREKVDPERLYI